MGPEHRSLLEFPLRDWLLLGAWQPREKAQSGHGGGGMGQQTRLHLCSVFIHPKATPSLSLQGGKVQPGFFLQVPERGVVWNFLERALEELLGWEEDAILP